MTKTDRTTSLKPVDSQIIPEFIRRECSNKPMFQVEINGNLLPESFQNESSYTEFKKLEEEDVEK